MDRTELAKSRIKEIPGVLQALENGVMSGDINPLELLIIQKSFEKWIEYIKGKSELQEAVEKEFLKNVESGKKIKFRDAEITQNERDIWDFSPCPENDTILHLDAEISKLKEQKKAIEDTLKARYRIDDLLNANTGEVVEVIKPIKKGCTKYYSIKL
jgi:hypothetical protein